MLLYGDLSSDKTKILIENYVRLLNEGVPSDKILVIVQNSKLKEKFIKEAKKLLLKEAISKFNVYSYFGLCYNFILEYYPVLENKITKGKAAIIPNMCGLEASGHIFKEAIKKIVFKGYNSKTNLLHQLLRRQSLITLNALTDEEVHQRAKILLESFTEDVKNAINLYKQKTLEYRAFDYLRQVQLFSYLYKQIENRFEYVFIDDADEITPSLFEYLKYIKNTVKEFFIAYDPLGSSRKGYLCASENNFEALLNESPVNLKSRNEKADLIYKNIVEGKQTQLDNMIEKDFIRSDEMVDSVICDINNLINEGENPEDILVVIPENNDWLRLYLNKIASSVNFITGSEKIEDNKTIGALIGALKLIVETDNYKISSYKLKGILGTLISIDLNTTVKIIQEFESGFGCNNLFEILEKYKDIGKIEKFLEIRQNYREKKLSEILLCLAENFIDKIPEKAPDIQKVNGLIKQIKDFEDIFKEEVDKNELIFQLENTIISENPIGEEIILQNAVNIITTQKAIDFKLKNKYMFLIDTTNTAWVKQDIGPLYNAWVFQKNRIKKDFTLEDNILLSTDKTARMIRKLYLLNEGKIYSYSAVYDFLGAENYKGIKHFFKKEEVLTESKFKIIPRPDQKPVLDYKGGKFAVMAVAGAGKTTIMLALITKLLEDGISPENIFVLTYMDSASRTFKERIKSALPNLSDLPNISTIHGLSMRILRENNNHAHLGLDVDFDIIDEIKRLKLITEILYTEGGDIQKINYYERAISAFKNSKNRNENNLSPAFKRIFKEYQRNLKELNLIDYDDLLILALELLKQNSKIREYYQNLAHYVIEDEAQDSSSIQQELINIISKKYGNLIRCGDVNQAITGSFTNSDTEGFKRFIRNNEGCKMNYTARNSTGVIDLANKTIKEGLKISPTSFLEIETKPVAGKNIIDPNACQMKIFDKEEDEKKFITENIHKIFSEENKASVGILTRTNKEAEIWAEYIKSITPFKVNTSTGGLNQDSIFLTVLSIFNFISNPMNNNLILDFAKIAMNLGFYTGDSTIFEHIKKNNSPFILENNEDFAIWWDLRYFLELTVLSPYELAFKIGEFYFAYNKNKKANIALVASIVAKIFNVEKNFEDTLNKMNELQKRPQIFNVRLFEEEKEKESENEIFIMTLHKSKGDEFDYVFIPSLTNRNMGLILNDIKLKEGNKIAQEIQNLKKSEEELKTELIDENLRLLYVGITRAKKKLFLSSAKQYKIFNKITPSEPSVCFEFLGETK